MVFIETPVFTAQIKTLVSDEDYAALQRELTAHPEAGDVISGTGGLRKIRMAARGKGKRGGARVIYFYFVANDRIAMLLAYPKGVKDDLTVKEKRIIAGIIKTWRHAR
jgi:RelE toxin of RelEB toxin-antitoxin system